MLPYSILRLTNPPTESNTGLDMAPFIRNISFHSINLVGLRKHDLAKCSSVMQEVVNLFHQNIAKPIHPTTFMSFSQIEEGFRLMQMGKHVGKIVLEVGDNDLVPVRSILCICNPAGSPKTNQKHRSFLLVSNQFSLMRTLHTSLAGVWAVWGEALPNGWFGRARSTLSSSQGLAIRSQKRKRQSELSGTKERT